MVEGAAKRNGVLDYCGQRPTEAQIKDIATIRQYLAALSEEQKKTLIRIYMSFRHENEGEFIPTNEEELVDLER